MKTLAFGLVIILVIGLGGFFYRNVMEQEPVPEPIACTMDAKMCPDGSAVGRSGPLCEFTACALPNMEDREVGFSFVIPDGYVENSVVTGADAELRLALDKAETIGGIPHNIVVRRFEIPEGETAEEVMVGETLFEISGIEAESIDQFTEVVIGGRTYYEVTVERFEAQIHTLYYLARAEDVLRFEVLERNVVDWMEPELVVSELPEHSALRSMLETLQVSE